MQLAHRIRFVPNSPTLALTARAQAMKAEGKDVISLTIGEPDFPTPEHIIRAAKKALDEGATRYTPAAGMPILRKAVARDFQEAYGLDEVAPKEVIVSSGAKHSLYNAMMALINPGGRGNHPGPVLGVISCHRHTGLRDSGVRAHHTGGTFRSSARQTQGSHNKAHKAYSSQ